LNRASFSEIGINAPLQNAHPTGAKLPANIRISPMKGLDMVSSAPSRGVEPLDAQTPGDPAIKNC